MLSKQKPVKGKENSTEQSYHPIGGMFSMDIENKEDVVPGSFDEAAKTGKQPRVIEARQSVFDLFPKKPSTEKGITFEGREIKFEEVKPEPTITVPKPEEIQEIYTPAAQVRIYSAPKKRGCWESFLEALKFPSTHPEEYPLIIEEPKERLKK